MGKHRKLRDTQLQCLLLLQQEGLHPPRVGTQSVHRMGGSAALNPRERSSSTNGLNTWASR